MFYILFSVFFVFISIYFVFILFYVLSHYDNIIEWKKYASPLFYLLFYFQKVYLIMIT